MPKVPDGAVVIFDPDRDYQHGSLVLAKRASEQNATFKQLWYDGDTPYLRPLNERYPIMAMPPDATIIAVAVRLELDL
jgi:SOS-response transcriptional repressor LexA